MRNRGFTLIETGIVLFILSVILAFTVPLLMDFKKDANKIELMNQHIGQFKILNNAAANWAGSTFDDLSDDSSGTVSINLLKTDNYLPENFAFQYSNSVPQDILGNEFKVYWNKKNLEYMGVEKQRVRTLSIADSPLQWQSHPQIFVPNKFAHINNQDDYIGFVDSWYSSLLNKAAAKGLVVGIIKNNSNMIVGSNQSFKFELDTTDFNIPQRPYKRVVVFHGWPDINDLGNEGGGGGSGTIEESVYKDCMVGRVTADAWLNVSHYGNDSYSITNGTQNFQCPSGYQVMADLTTTGESTEMILFPGWANVFATVKSTIVSNLGSLGSYCSNEANQWCRAKNSSYCDSSNPYSDDADAYRQACNIEPIYAYDVIINLNGAEYKSYRLYQYGYYEIGTVGSTRYSVSTTPAGTSKYIYSQQHLICCPSGTPPLE